MIKDTRQSDKVNEPEDQFLLYFDPKYHQVQKYDKLVAFDRPQFASFFSIHGQKAISLSASPFGGIQILKEFSDADLAHYLDQVEGKLKEAGIHFIEIIQPPNYYAESITIEKLSSFGYESIIAETNQFVNLDKPIPLHEMQIRKLNKPVKFQIRKANTGELEKIHYFISKCRLQQGLEINISCEKLKALFGSFPDRYEAFVVEEKQNLVSAVIMTRPTTDICYYYLPATEMASKNKSPMVHMLAFLYTYYKNEGFKIMDLGISSINGELQQSLFQFKKRMGAESTDRVLLRKNI